MLQEPKEVEMLEQKRNSGGGFTPMYFIGTGIVWAFLAGLLVYAGLSDPSKEIFCLVFGSIFLVAGIIFVGIGLVSKLLRK